MRCIYSWGANNCGQLGDNSTDDKLLPSKIEGFGDHEEDTHVIGGGGGFSFLLTGSGRLQTCGNNERGQQGKHDKTNTLCFTPPPTLPLSIKYVKVTAGWDFLLALTGEGKILSWGSNSFGQLGRQCPAGQNFDSVPGEVSMGSSCVKVTDVEAGLRHAVVLTDSQEILTWGHGRKGQLGQTFDTGELKTKSEIPAKVNITARETLTSVVAGMYHTGALTASGALYVWGCNKYGQCAQDPSVTSVVTKPSLVDFKDVNRGTVIAEGDAVIKLTSGWTHLTARTAKGHLLSWGRADLGQLGRACTGKFDWVPRQIALKPVVAQTSGSEHNLALTADGEVFSWGWNEHGICGTGDETNVNTPSRISTFLGKQVIAIGCGAGHSFCITQDK